MTASKGRLFYLGLRLPQALRGTAIHLPLIETRTCCEPLPVGMCRTVVVTSRTTVEVLSRWTLDWSSKVAYVVGRKTANECRRLLGTNIIHVAQPETAEGVCTLLKQIPPIEPIFYPHSLCSRPVLSQFLLTHFSEVHEACVYDTRFRHFSNPPVWSEHDRFMFTSPSTVDAFVALYHCLPSASACHCIGPITQARWIEKSAGNTACRLTWYI